eukprot:UN05745
MDHYSTADYQNLAIRLSKALKKAGKIVTNYNYMTKYINSFTGEDGVKYIRILEAEEEKVCLEIGEQLLKHKYILSCAQKNKSQKKPFKNSASRYFRFNNDLLEKINQERQKLKGDRSHWGIGEKKVEVLVGGKWVTGEIIERNETRGVVTITAEGSTKSENRTIHIHNI